LRITELAAFHAIVPLAVVVTLTVGAAPQARFGENFVIDFALFFQGDFVFKDVNLGR
jgi:hypothetical protein